MLSKPEVESSDGQILRGIDVEVQQVAHHVGVLGAIQPMQTGRRREGLRGPVELVLERGDHGIELTPDRAASCRAAASAPHGPCEPPAPTSRGPCPRWPDRGRPSSNDALNPTPAAFIFSLWQAMQVPIQERALRVRRDRRESLAPWILDASTVLAGCWRRPGAPVAGEPAELRVVGADSGRPDWAWTAKATSRVATQPTTSDLNFMYRSASPEQNQTKPKAEKPAGLIGYRNPRDPANPA